MKILVKTKKILAATLLISMLSVNIPALAENSAAAEIPTVKVQSENAVRTNTNVISPELEKELKSNLSAVYGSKNVDEIYNNIVNIAQKAVKDRPQNLIQEDINRKSDWYKDEIIYMFYVDQFGVINPEKPNSFKDSIQMLDYLKDLGVTKGIQNQG